MLGAFIILKFFFKVNKLNKDLFINRFSLNSPILKNGIWFKSDKKPPKYSAHLSLLNNGKVTSYWFLEKSIQIIKKSAEVPSLVLSMDSKKTLCGNFKFTKNLSGEFFLDALVEANKKLHSLEEQKIINGKPKIQLVYFENINNLSLLHDNIIINNILNREVKNTIFTLSQITNDKLLKPITICFSYLKKL